MSASIILTDRLHLVSANEGDFDELAEIRMEALRVNYERIGLFEPECSRERLRASVYPEHARDPVRSRDRLRASFHPEHTRHIVYDGQRIGFNITRPVEDGWLLDHTYIRHQFHDLRVGLDVVRWATRVADAHNQPIRTVRLKGRADGFLLRLGFVVTHEDDYHAYFSRQPHARGRVRVEPVAEKRNDAANDSHRRSEEEPADRVFVNCDAASGIALDARVAGRL